MSGAAKLVHGVVEFLEFVGEQVPKGLHAAHTHVAEVLEKQSHAFKALDEDLRTEASGAGHEASHGVPHEGRPATPGAGTVVDRVVEPRDLASNEERFQAYLQRAEQMDVSTSRDASNFYSGGPRAARAALDRADETATTTLERTEGGKWMDDEKLFEEGSPLTVPQALEVWQRLSERYAERASGDTHAFLNDPNPKGVFYLKELPALKSGLEQGRITSITIHDLVTQMSTTWTGPPGPPLPGQ